MKEELENWNIHLENLCKLSVDQLNEHSKKAVLSLINKKSWKATSKLTFTNWRMIKYPAIIKDLDFQTDHEKLSADKFIHLFFVSLSFFRSSIEKQDKNLHSEYRIIKKRMKDLEEVNDLINRLTKKLKREKIFLNYYSNFFDQNFEFLHMKELEDDMVNHMITDKNYLGLMPDRYIECELHESGTPTVLDRFNKELKHLNEILDPVFFSNLHLSKYKSFYLSDLKWYATYQLVQTFKAAAPKGMDLPSPWKFISDYFEVFFTISDLKDDFPTDFNPKNLQSKYRSVKKTSKK